MKIERAYCIVTCPGRNFVTLKIVTDEGVTGIGDGTLNGREKAVVAYLEDHVIPCLIGRDPHQIEDIWQYLHKGAYWRRGPVTMSAIAAVDTALWDIKAKALDALRQVTTLLTAKAPGDAAAYKAWLAHISQNVAEASKEGGFLGFGGVQVSDAEKATLAEISAALA